MNFIQRRILLNERIRPDRESDELWTPRDVARHLSVAPRTVWRWIQQGQLRAFKVGRLYRIRKTDVENLLRDV